MLFFIPLFAFCGIVVYMEHTQEPKKTWHAKHVEALSIGDRIADKVALVMGSWTFIIWQSAVVILWVLLNIAAIMWQWDPYPFILLNLLFSTQAAYAAPIIMMSQNRHAERDRFQANEDYETNVKAKLEIEALQKHLSAIDLNKLDKILALLESQHSKKG